MAGPESSFQDQEKQLPGVLEPEQGGRGVGDGTDRPETRVLVPMLH